jgi:GNAT superfamily N-acetyltransferase
MSYINIYEAVKDDLRKIIPLWKEMIEFHLQIDKNFELVEGADIFFINYIEEGLEDNSAIVYIAEINNTPVAYCIARKGERPPVFKKNKCGIISDLAVTKEYRNQGIGRELFLKAKDWIHSNGLSLIQLDVSAKNELSNQFWKKLGFKEYMTTLSLD